jgi:photosynthetic reaction center cytochrome c subunit
MRESGAEKSVVAPWNRVWTALGLAVGVALLADGSPALAQTPRRPRPLENIKVLKGWDGDEVRAEMRLITEALGVKCDHCHVQGNFASDEKRAKQTARRMIDLTRDLNGEYFLGYEPSAGQSKLGRVTCYTCHQGAVSPRMSAGAGGHAW